MRIALSLLMLLLVSFAGCVDTDEEPDAASPEVAQLQPRPGKEQADPAPQAEPEPEPAPKPAGNQAPNMTLSASALEGVAPLEVTFSVDASDADGDELRWALDADGQVGNETEDNNVPGSFTYTFEEAGSYDATAFVTDQNGSIVQSSVTIVVAAPAPAAPEPWAGIDVSKPVSIACYSCGFLGAGGSASVIAGVPGGDATWFELPAEAKGKEFKVSSSFGDPDVEFGTDCTALFLPEGASAADGAETGTIPAAANCVFAWEYDFIGTGGVDIRLEVYA